MMKAVETSLKRLKTDHIDLYYLHMWDFMTPVEEVMRGLDDLVRSGKVLYVGISDTPAWVVSKANMLADLRGWSRFVALQLPYSIAARAPERDLLPMAREEDIAVTAWGILGSGTLTGKYREKDATKRYEGTSEERMKVGDEVVKIAEEIGHTPSQVAINWVRQRPWSGAPIIPILGARTQAQIKDNLGALDFELTPDQIAKLDELGAIDLGFPHTFLRNEEVINLIFGETLEQTDNHREAV
jgi:aryl-alcohol dehydrogenase-like predicted oxidoreductase